MRLLNRSYKSFIFRSELISYIISILATCGTFIVLIGGVWDASSHELRIPDTFWTVQHMTIYAGASIVTLSAVMGVLTIMKGGNKKLHLAILIITAGTLAQLLGGYFDYISHTKYGIDGLITPSHLTVETGLLLSAIGGMMILSKVRNASLKALIPISIITVLLSASWIGFNLSLLLGAVVECVPVYQLFSSGCAVM